MTDGFERRREVLSAALAQRYAATFDRDARETGPQGIHWCLNTPDAATAALGTDGHPLRTDYPDLPRRMWASSEVDFLAPIPVGAEVERVSHSAETREKAGKSGRLVFVTMAHKLTANGVAVLNERQTIVYRAAAAPDDPAPPPPPPLEPQCWSWRREIRPEPPLLFRYSALTFNSHRIHYDRPYAMQEEGYPGLVVHGPLMASLLLDLADRHLGPDALTRFAFRAISPAFAGATLHLLGRQEGSAVTLAVSTPEGGTIMTATAETR